MNHAKSELRLSVLFVVYERSRSGAALRWRRLIRSVTTSALVIMNIQCPETYGRENREKILATEPKVLSPEEIEALKMHDWNAVPAQDFANLLHTVEHLQKQVEVLKAPIRVAPSDEEDRSSWEALVAYAYREGDGALLLQKITRHYLNGRAEVEHLQLERDKFQSALESSNASAQRRGEQIASLQKRLEQAEGDGRRLKEAMKRYGRHTENCNYNRLRTGSCDCGRADAPSVIRRMRDAAIALSTSAGPATQGTSDESSAVCNPEGENER